MNFLTYEQYERIARYLDGEAVLLTSEEAAAVRDLRQGELDLGESLPVPFEGGANQRVWQGVRGAIRPARRPIRRGLWGAAAAAAVVAAFMSHYWSPAPLPHRTEQARLSSPQPQPQEQPQAQPQPQPPRAPHALPPVEPRAYDDQVAAIGNELDRDLRALETNSVLSLTPTSVTDGVGAGGESTDVHQAPTGDPTRG